jgi:hypothetical protein
MDQLKGIKMGLGIASVSVAAFGYGIKKLMDDAIQTSFSLKQFNAETGLSTDKLQRWQSVADEVNNSGKAVAESIKAIVSNQEKIKLGQGNISGYQLLGIDPRQNAFTILDQLRVKTRGLSQGMKKNILEQMGISKELIQVLELSKDKFDEMAKGAFIIPKGAIDMIDKARASMKSVEGGISYLKAMIAAGLTPSIIKVNKEILKWIQQNKEGLVKGIKTLFDWVTRIVRAIIDTFRAINDVIKSTIGWKNALLVLAGVFAIMNLPLTLIVAGIVLLIAVIQDLYRYSQGKKSLFGIMLKEFPALDKAFGGIKKLFDSISKLFEKLGKSGILKEIGDGIKDALGQALTDALATLTAIIDGLNTIVGLFTGEIKLEDFGKSILDWSKKLENWAGVGNWFQDILTGGGSKQNRKIMEDIIKQKQLEKLNKQTTNITNNNVNIDVQTKGDAKETADLVKKKFDEELQKEKNNVDIDSED